jgi:hypothetical protein
MGSRLSLTTARARRSMLLFRAKMDTGRMIMVARCSLCLVSCSTYLSSQAHVSVTGLIICCYITGTELRPEQKIEMIRYLRSRQNGDGGWGLCVGH